MDAAKSVVMELIARPTAEPSSRFLFRDASGCMGEGERGRERERASVEGDFGIFDK
jgi:hypothetical protein